MWEEPLSIRWKGSSSSDRPWRAPVRVGARRRTPVRVGQPDVAARFRGDGSGRHGSSLVLVGAGSTLPAERRLAKSNWSRVARPRTNALARLDRPAARLDRNSGAAISDGRNPGISGAWSRREWLTSGMRWPPTTPALGQRRRSRRCAQPRRFNGATPSHRWIGSEQQGRRSRSVRASSRRTQADVDHCEPRRQGAAGSCSDLPAAGVRGARLVGTSIRWALPVAA